MRKVFLTTGLMCVLGTALVAQELPTTTDAQAQQNANKQLKLQNKTILSMAVERLNKDVPKKIDDFTTLESISSKNLTLIYHFSINAKKSDDAIIKEDHSRMKTMVTKGTCHSSKRFLESDINILYVYKSAKSQKELFQIDVTKKDCFYIWGGRDKLPNS
jgi:hypothetical protein